MANISLTPHMEKFLQDKVKSGNYSTVSEVVRDALRFFEEKDQERERRLETLRAQIEEGLKASREGRVIDGEVVFKELDAKLQKITQKTK